MDPIFRPAAPERAVNLAGTGASVMAGVVALGGALLVRAVYDRILPSGNGASLVAVGVGFALAYGVEHGFRFLHRRWTDAAAVAAEERLSSGLFDRVLRAKAGALPPAHRTTALFAQVESAKEAGSVASTIVPDLLVSAMLLAALAVVSPPVASVAAGVGGAVLAGAMLLSCAIDKAVLASATTAATKQQLLTEAVLGQRDLKVCRAEGRYGDLMDKAIAESADRSDRVRRLSSWAVGLTGLGASAIYGATLLVGAALTMDGAMTMGSMIAAGILAGRATQPILALAANAVRLGRARAAVEALRPIASAAVEDGEGKHNETLKAAPRVAFEDVTFRYHGEARVVLKDLFLTVEPGERVALVGPSGCGKSTMGALLAGLADLTGDGCSGIVALDGLSVAHMAPDCLRSAVGVGLQSPFLFSGTIRDNIALADPGLSDEAVVEAARLAGADEWIRRRADGYATRVHDGGAMLSGGERATLGMARLFAADPKAVFFDEPTANLDTDAAARLKERLACWLEGRTALIATHRLEVLDLVSKVFLIRDGRALGPYTPAEIVASTQGRPLEVRLPKAA